MPGGVLSGMTVLPEIVTLVWKWQFFYCGFFGKIIRYRNNPFCEQLPMIDKIHGCPGDSIRFHYGVFEVKAAEYWSTFTGGCIKNISIFVH